MSYSSIIVEDHDNFSWNYPYTNGVIISDINDLTSNSDVSASMPAANNISVGTSVFFNNIGAYNITIYNYGTDLIAKLTPGSVVTIYLIDSYSAAGGWRAVQTNGGSLGIMSLDVVASDTAISVQGSPVTAGTSGKITIGTDYVLQSLSSLKNSSSQGILVSTAIDASVITTRSLVAGSGIDITNADGVAGNIRIDLSDTIPELTSLDVGGLSLSDNSITVTNADPININGVEIDNAGNIIIPGTITSSTNLVQVITTWGYFNNIRTTTQNIIKLFASNNIQSIAVTDLGYYKITFTIPMTDINYGVVITPGSSGTPPNILVRHGYPISKQTTDVVIALVDASGQLVSDAPDGITIILTQ